MSEQEHDEAEVLQPGVVVDDYRVERLLGCGAMSMVYLAISMTDGTRVALKIMKSSVMGDAELYARFCNEGEAASRLNHANIIRAIASGQLSDGRPYFCMEYAQGESLLELLKNDGVVPLKQAMRLFVDISAALEYGWDNFRFVHGDIKPENIMVTPSGEAKLVDFGLSRVDGAEYTGKDIVLTPLYAAPELIRGESTISCRSDIYAFGATLFHAVAGEPPFPGEDTDAILDKQMNEVPEPLSLRKSEVPQELSDFIASTLEKEPSKRPESWTVIRGRLMEIYLALMNPPKSLLESMAVDDEADNHLSARVREPKKVWTVQRLAYIMAGLILIGICGYLAFAKGHGAAPGSQEKKGEVNQVSTEVMKQTEVKEIAPKTAAPSMFGTPGNVTTQPAPPAKSANGSKQEPVKATPPTSSKAVIVVKQAAPASIPETTAVAPAAPAPKPAPPAAKPAPSAAPAAKPAAKPVPSAAPAAKPAAKPAPSAAPAAKPAAKPVPPAAEEGAAPGEPEAAPKEKEEEAGEEMPVARKRIPIEWCQMSDSTREKVQLALLAAEMKKMNLKETDIAGITRRMSRLKKESGKYSTHEAREALQCLATMTQKLGEMPEVMSKFQSLFTRRKIDKYLVMSIAVGRVHIVMPGEKKPRKMSVRDAVKLDNGAFVQGIGKFLWAEMQKMHVRKPDYYEAVIAGMFFAGAKEATTYSLEKKMLVKECRILGKLLASPPNAKYIEVGKAYAQLQTAARNKDMAQVETLAKQLQVNAALLSDSEQVKVKKIVAALAPKKDEAKK